MTLDVMIETPKGPARDSPVELDVSNSLILLSESPARPACLGTSPTARRLPLFKATGDSGMPANADDKVGELLKPMPKKRLFVVFSKAMAPPEDLPPFVAEHFAYMNHLESAGKLFVSGPFEHEGVLAGDGLTILQTETMEDANALMQAEPLIRRSLRQFDLRPWELH
jgi:uncharacterized protein YciI